ncbi:hypothetical protein ROG8370_03588 [Roseovarius gaetbuli]|uniref:DUF3800 domain-containing protein n=1 Tax=Roseovarius gaetbuli TaxID=1356575 RepID=A0A1X7A915_9RHOB|nr:hypothetical protein [Roseovarius gaetbuli]SLN73209.1 hypothetical protein ROG8370_03588 [Roseovarius gaetbuli]
MQNKYTLLIDESGDQGLDRVMTHENPFGASSYLTMGAALVPTVLSDQYRQTLGDISDKLRLSQLHCTDLNHPQVAYFSRELSKLRILCFGVVSKKSTLGSYREMIAGEDQAHDYYNKCSQYLLELVGAYAESKGISSTDISIVFERKRGHDYGRLGRYLKAISDKPIHPKAAKLSYLSPFAITAMTEPLPAGAGRISDVLFQVLKMGWLPPSPDGIAMCQDGGL